MQGEVVSQYRREWFGIFQTRDGRHEVRNLASGRTVKSFKHFGSAIRLRDRLCAAETENVEVAAGAALTQEQTDAG